MQKQKLPIFSFCYSNSSKSEQDMDDVRSIYSYRTNLTKNSRTSSQTKFERLNELKTKAKIRIPTFTSKRQSALQPPQMRQMPSPSLNMEALTTCQSQNLNYSEIKPFFNWGKIGLLCSINSKTIGSSGCSCDQPCRWKLQWTKNHHRNDTVAYKKLVQQAPTRQNLSQIDKDVHRTYSDIPTFYENRHFRQMLREVLICYSVYDIQLGYVQGLNMITAVLLYHIKQAEKTFWALVQMMEYQQLRMIYVGRLEYLEMHVKKIENLIQIKLNDLFQHMNSLGIDCRYFLNGWVLSLMSNVIPLEEMQTVLNKFRKYGWSYIYRLTIAFLCFLKESLMLSQEQAEFLMYLNSQYYKQLQNEWQVIIKSADKFQL